MALPTSYLTGGFHKVPSYFDALLSAKAPEKFTAKFFKDLGFTSSIDTLFINVLKFLGLLDDAGVPTERYYKFLDQTNSKKIIAISVEEAYSDLFQLNANAQDLSKKEIEGKFKTLTSGSKTDKVIGFMVSTFKELCDYADWTKTKIQTLTEKPIENSSTKEPTNDHEGKSLGLLDLSYDIHIHLPATRDQAVYDALFASLSKHISTK